MATTTHYKFANGKFIEDTENFHKFNDTAFTIYTGAVIVLTGCYFDRIHKKFCGTRRDGTPMELKPSSILNMEAII